MLIVFGEIFTVNINTTNYLGAFWFLRYVIYVNKPSDISAKKGKPLIISKDKHKAALYSKILKKIK